MHSARFEARKSAILRNHDNEINSRIHGALGILVGNDRIRSCQVETARVEIYSDAVSMGKAAAQAAAEAIKEIEKRQETINVIFATGASQLVTLDALTKMDNLPWTRVRGFHMDEYIGLPITIRRRFADTYERN
jgi:glucosamine-6-phosphate deaminase